MKFAWRSNIGDFASWNSSEVEDINLLSELQALLNTDCWQDNFDNDCNMDDIVIVNQISLQFYLEPFTFIDINIDSPRYNK